MKYATDTFFKKNRQYIKTSLHFELLLFIYNQTVAHL